MSGARIVTVQALLEEALQGVARVIRHRVSDVQLTWNPGSDTHTITATLAPDRTPKEEEASPPPTS